jgi:hypothetical protein
MNYLEKTGCVSGFDPENKLVSLSVVLRTLMASYARINIRNGHQFFSMVDEPYVYFMLPLGASDIVIWSMGYKVCSKGISDCITFNLKPIKRSTEFTQETPTIYKLIVNAPEVRENEGNYYFYIVSYTLNGVEKNSYLSFFVERSIKTNDRQNQFLLISEYLKYLCSGNKNYGEFFNTYKTSEGAMVINEKQPNRHLEITSIPENDFATMDYIVLPMVIKTERKNRAGEVMIIYTTAYANEMSECCHMLFKYIKAIHDSGLLHLPNSFSSPPNDGEVLNVSGLIRIFTQISGNGRKLDRILVVDSNMSRLLFGTDGRWLVSILGQDTKFKSPGNGSLLQILCGKCSEDIKIREICSQLSVEVDGFHNDFLGKSTVELENSMFSGANMVRSVADVAFTYQHLKKIDTTQAYYDNYANLFRLMASLRETGGDYFVSLLQPSMNFSGKRNNSQTQDSLKLMSLFMEPKHLKAFRDKDGHVSMISRIDGGIFLTMRKEYITDENRSILCPYETGMKEINDIYSMFGDNAEFCMPLRVISGLGQTVKVSLIGSNDHTPLNVRFLSDGTMIPIQSIPFNGNTLGLEKLDSFKDRTLSFILCHRFIMKLERIVPYREYTFACGLAKRLRGSGVSIYDLLPHKEITVSSDATFAEENIPSVYANFVMNCDAKYKNHRKTFLTKESILSIMEETMPNMGNEDFLTSLDRVNGFLLCSDFKKTDNYFYQHLALFASVIYARNNLTKVSAENRPDLPITTLLPNFGQVPHYVSGTGDVLIRTMNPSMSQRSNCINMLLATKKWSYLMGCVPKNEHNIDTSRNKYSSRNAISNKNDFKTIERTSETSNVISHKTLAFAELFGQRIATFGRSAYERKPEKRKLVLSIVDVEWKSLLTLPLSRKEDQHVSIQEFCDLIHTQLKSSFVIDECIFRTTQYKTQHIQSFVENLKHLKCPKDASRQHGGK